MQEISAGGVVFYQDKILVLQKYSGAWVLPKGGVEQGETLEVAALREVEEEASVRASIGEYIGSIQYRYFNREYHTDSTKRVHWFVMDSKTSIAYPQQAEGFSEAKFIDYQTVIDKMSHIKERTIVEKAVAMTGVDDGLFKNSKR